MKRINIIHYIFLALATTFWGCTDKDVDNARQKFCEVKAVFPEDIYKVGFHEDSSALDQTDGGQKKVRLEQDGTSRDMITRWQDDDKICVIIGKETDVRVLDPVPVRSLSQDKKSCTFQYAVPDEWNSSDLVYNLSCFTADCEPKFVDGELYCNATLKRMPIDKFRARVMFDGQVSDYNYYGVFQHYGTYEILHMSNNSDKEIQFALNDFNVNTTWYKRGGFAMRMSDKKIVVDLSYEWQPQSPTVKIPAHGSETIVTWYIPNGNKIEDAQMVATIDGQTVYSENKINSTVEIKTGVAYHMYASWDGNELKFEDGDIDDGHNSADAEDLVINGNFNLGNVGFTSDYEYVSETGSSMVPENRYTVGTSPRNYHPGFIIHGDHTTGDGNMLIANGSPNNSKYVWKQSVYVEKGKTYEFSAWFLSVSENTPLNKDMIEYVINDEANLGEYDKTENDWQRYYWRYTATESGYIDIKIRSLSSAASGNDFAIDDISFTSNFSDQECYLTCPDDNHPHIIDMGEAGKWACCNVGSSAPWEYGGYYAWGETKEKDNYSWNNYLHCDGDEDTCHDIGDDIAGTNYDVAHVKWGNNWKIPNLEQLNLLIDKCSSEWTTFHNINGRKFTSPNGGSIFLPATGCYSGNSINQLTKEGYYWTSTKFPVFSSACNFIIDNNGLRKVYESYCTGLSVRPIWDDSSEDHQGGDTGSGSGTGGSDSGDGSGSGGRDRK